jgi:16S rRNA (guanine527-N7)-methyltransferase
VNEDEAKDWLHAHLNVSRETLRKLEMFVEMVRRESQVQNLIAASTLPDIWARHVVDSAQLLPHSSNMLGGRWLDLGSGAGFPGLVVAILSRWPVVLAESRRLRIDFLKQAVAELGLGQQVQIHGMAVERLDTAAYAVISARAFAPLPRLFDLAARFSTDKTLWLLPKGRNAAKEWDETQGDWDGDFRIQPSVTDPEAGILIGRLTGRKGTKAGKGQKGGRQ